MVGELLIKYQKIQEKSKKIKSRAIKYLHRSLILYQDHNPFA